MRFESGAGTQRHSYVGARLFDVLTAAGPRFDPAVKNAQLTFSVLVTATDGYRSLVASTGTPIIDLKPYVAAFDRPEGDPRSGWLDEVPLTEGITPADLATPRT